MLYGCKTWTIRKSVESNQQLAVVEKNDGDELDGKNKEPEKEEKSYNEIRIMKSMGNRVFNRGLVDLSPKSRRG